MCIHCGCSDDATPTVTDLQSGQTAAAQVVHVHEHAIAPPEAILELEEEPAGCGRQPAVQIEVKQQVASGRSAETEEGRVPLDPPSTSNCG